MLKHWILNLGRIKTTILITLCTTVLSIMITLGVVLIANAFSFNLNPKAAFFISTLVPLVITPIFSWYLIGLMLKINYLEAKMRNLATYDSLTGLVRREVFFEKAEQVFETAKQDGGFLSVLVIDLDNFKDINDFYGHFIADQALAEFGKILDQTARKTTLVGRLGGDEFICLINNAPPEKALAFCKKLQKRIERINVHNNGTTSHLTISVGIAAGQPGQAATLSVFCQKADQALYEAKNAGRNCIRLYEEIGG